MESKYHQPHIPLHLKPITTKTLDMKPKSFADFSRSAADCSRTGCMQAVWSGYILVLARLGLVQKSELWH